MKRALVTGASGFVGRALVALLQNDGWSAGKVTRSLPALAVEPSLFQLEDGSVTRFGAILDAFEPDVVFHLAGRTGASGLAELYSANVLLAANLLEAVQRRKNPPVVVLAGSAAEYGFVTADEMPVDEERPCRPFSDYGISKLAQTLTGLARAAAGLPVLVARIFNPVGPGMPEHLALASFAAQLRRSDGACELRVGNLEVERDFIDVDEAARLIAALGSVTTLSFGKVVNICSGRGFKLRRLVEDMIVMSGRPVRIVVDSANMRSNDMPTFVGSTARLQALGLHPRTPDFEALLPRMLNLVDDRGQ